MTDPTEIRRRLADIRRDGFCWMYSEFDEQLNSVAAPVINNDGETVGALHIHGPAYRFPGDGEPNGIAELVRASAHRLAGQLA